METEINHDDLDALRQQAQELNARLTARENEIARARAEFNRIPELAANLRTRLSAVQAQRTALNEENLRAEFCSHYE